jgi:hypothetical protein
MGIACFEELVMLDENVSSPEFGSIGLTGLHEDVDPLWLIDRLEALRLIQVYEEECGLMYPIIDIKDIEAHAQNLYSLMELWIKTNNKRESLLSVTNKDDVDTSLLKIILATAMTIDGHGESRLGTRLYETLRLERNASPWTGCPSTDMKKVIIIVVTVSPTNSCASNLHFFDGIS